MRAAIARAARAGLPPARLRDAEARLRQRDAAAAERLCSCASATPFSMAAYQAALDTAARFELCERHPSSQLKSTPASLPCTSTACHHITTGKRSIIASPLFWIEKNQQVGIDTVSRQLPSRHASRAVDVSASCASIVDRRRRDAAQALTTGLHSMPASALQGMASAGTISCRRFACAILARCNLSSSVRWHAPVHESMWAAV